MKRLMMIAALLCSTLQMAAQTPEESQDWINCFAILAGKNTTADGSVLLAHNEDDGGEQMLNVYVVLAGYEKISEKSLPEGWPAATAGMLWFEFPRMEAADAFLNRYGVAMVSNNCPSREDKPDLTDGGLLYDLRVLAAQHCRSAKEAVKLIGAIVEKHGYRGSGRTYTVADRNEGWTVSVVNGRHWVAVRIPDDKVMALPNNYIIDKVNLADTVNFLGSADLVSYAIERGWYNPKSDGDFSFKKAYCKPSTYTSQRNYLRQHAVMELLSGERLAKNPDSLKFCFAANRKLTIKDMIDALSIHAAPVQEGKGKHSDLVCTGATILPAVFQLRSNMPVEVGAVAWVGCGRPCVEALIPWYCGMTEVPLGYGRYNSAKEAYRRHFTDATELQKNYPNHFYWFFTEGWKRISGEYNSLSKNATSARDDFQKRLFERQKMFETKVNRLLKSGKAKVAEKELNAYTARCYKEYMK